jgi:hypothetical protein
MSDKQREYQRLPGSSLRTGFLTVRGIRQSLWLGDDHLLRISCSGYSEDYKRFYYRDIQAIITQKTQRGGILTIVFASLAVLTAAVFTPIGINTGRTAFVIGTILFGIFIIPLVINVALGPTCVCHLCTAVQMELLRSLRRLRTARAAIRLLRPLVEQAQGGGLTMDTLEARAVEAAQNRLPEAPSRTAAAQVPAPLVHYEGTAHQILFSLLLFDAALRCADIFYNNFAMVILANVMFLVLFAFVILALVKQHGTDITKELRGLVWGTLIYLCVLFYVGNVHMQIVAVDVAHPEVFTSPWELHRAVGEMSPWEHPFLLGLLVVSALCSLFLGSLGFLMLRDFRRIRPRPPGGELSASAGE